MFYKLRLGTLTSLYSQRKEVTQLLSECLMSGILEVGPDEEYHRFILFNNGVRYTFWNANKYYAWMTEGDFYDEVDRTSLYRFSQCRPSWKYIFRTKKAMKKYHKLQVPILDNDIPILDNNIERIYRTIQHHANESN